MPFAFAGLFHRGRPYIRDLSSMSFAVKTLEVCPGYQMKHKYAEKYSVLVEQSVIHHNILD